MNGEIKSKIEKYRKENIAFYIEIKGMSTLSKEMGGTALFDSLVSIIERIKIPKIKTEMLVFVNEEEKKYCPDFSLDPEKVEAFFNAQLEAVGKEVVNVRNLGFEPIDFRLLIERVRTTKHKVLAQVIVGRLLCLLRLAAAKPN